MADDWRPSVRKLLDSSRVAFLSTIGDSGPETSMAPYAIQSGDVLLHLSKLARHTSNIGRDAHMGLMICTPETLADSPLALPRISLAGRIATVAEHQLAEARHTYLQHIPDAEGLFSFPDFQLFRLEVERIHWVGGFGMARTIPRQGWNSLFETAGE